LVPLFLSIPAALILLNKKVTSSIELFISTNLILLICFCQFLYGAPRYYVSTYIFFLFCLVLLVPIEGNILYQDLKLISQQVKLFLFVITAIFILFISLSIVLLLNFSEYDMSVNSEATPNAKIAYDQTNELLGSLSAKKVYFVNPISAALESTMISTLKYDTYSLIFLKNEQPEEFIQDRIDEGVEYAVINNIWIEHINPQDLAQRLLKAIRDNGRLIAIIEPETNSITTIYAFNVDRDRIFNGDFKYWTRLGNDMLSIGWMGSKVQKADIHGKLCVDIHSEGETESIFQYIKFPDQVINIEVLPINNTDMEHQSGIHFMADGHTLILGFSDIISHEEIIKSDDANTILVLRNAQLNNWTNQTIDLSYYWDLAKWGKPERLIVGLCASLNSVTMNNDIYISHIGENNK
jgi:hypothetical protein